MLRLQTWARALKRDVMTLWFALRHPDTPWYARLVAALVTAYALSPIDLIPDFIPVLGYLDDLIIVPAGVWLLLKIVPGHVLSDSRAQAERWFLQRREKPRSMAGLAIILAVWGLAGWIAYRLMAD
ncbi:MAG: DUF1232 domain-containing protein [Burkholderiales bacterium]|nr:DUF1232 domain-containing protein [Burkholderiales bacterium]